MVIVKIQAGLGNQLFQYAVGRSLARRLGTQLFLDTSFFGLQALYSAPVIRSYQLDHFKISAPILGPRMEYWIKQLRRRRLGRVRTVAQICGILRIEVDEQCGFDETLGRKGGNLYLDGYWQSERYFPDIRELLLEEFTLREPVGPDVGRMVARLNEEISVCVHIRRGDYFSTKEGIKDWAICGPDYYKSAMAYIGARVPGVKFFLFSDDPAWVQSNFPPSENLVIVSGHASPGDLEDFRLMMNCRHFIISNSSFSWWTAWLGKHQDKIVVAPKQWRRSHELMAKEIVPARWVRL